MANGDKPTRLSPRKILVRGVNWLGDAVMTTPALQRLRQRFPEAVISLSLPEKLADLFAGHPAVDAVVRLSKDESPWAVGRRLRPEGFDLAVVFPNSPRAALECWFAGIPQRIGYARPWRNLLLTHPIPSRPGSVPMRKRSEAEVRGLIDGRQNPAPAPGPEAHQLHEYLHLVGTLGADPKPLAPLLAVSESETLAAVAKFLPEGDKGRLLLGLNPGAEYGPAKRWPAENFAATAREVARSRPGTRWIAFGGPADAATAQAIVAGAEGTVQSVAGRTTLRELMALLRACRVLLTNDTGPMHIAAALGTPVVVPFGSTSLELTGPGLPGDPRHHFLRAGVPCSPCFLRACPIDFRCMNRIAASAATAEVLKVLDADKS